MESGEAPWYDVTTDNSLRQGDQFRGLRVFWGHPELRTAPRSSGDELVKELVGDFIVASASCDVAQSGYPYVLLLRVVEATTAALKVNTEDERIKKLEVMRLGLVPSQYLLAASPRTTPAFPLSFVQHKVHALVPVDYLQSCASAPRLRLRHPHRERFGGWVGSNFARVGPEDGELLKRFAKIHPKHVLEFSDE